jgi:NitT/TauT family transport system ATP-binding protein
MSVACRSVSLTFPSVSGVPYHALAEISLSVKGGEFVCIVGPSGSGKSTLLRVIAGLLQPTAGTVAVGDSESGTRIGMVFQGNSVFPWRTVEGNLSYALEVRGLGRAERSAEAARLCRLVGLPPDGFLEKYPKELSGGETRRVAIGMALGAKANVLLFDEPTSQLDYVAKLELGQTVQKLWLAERFSIIYVTHDIDEAIFLADRIVILRGGRVRSELPVGLPRPRDVNTLASGDFAALREDVLKLF